MHSETFDASESLKRLWLWNECSELHNRLPLSGNYDSFTIQKAAEMMNQICFSLLFT